MNCIIGHVFTAVPSLSTRWGTIYVPSPCRELFAASAVHTIGHTNSSVHDLKSVDGFRLTTTIWNHTWCWRWVHAGHPSESYVRPNRNSETAHTSHCLSWRFSRRCGGSVNPSPSVVEVDCCIIMKIWKMEMFSGHMVGLNEYNNFIPWSIVKYFHSLILNRVNGQIQQLT